MAKLTKCDACGKVQEPGGQFRPVLVGLADNIQAGDVCSPACFKQWGIAQLSTADEWAKGLFTASTK